MMFRRILVPLDGSTRAERALPLAARIAHAGGGSIVLLRAVDLPATPSTSVYIAHGAPAPLWSHETPGAEKAQAVEYLAAIVQSAVLASIRTEAKTVIGAVEAVIEELADEGQIDLVVMCSHGDTGFKRWMLGSVAQQVARHVKVPALVLHQAGTNPRTPFPDRLRPLRSIVALVALDGSTFAEAALEPAAKLVAALASPAQGTLLLTRVVTLPVAGAMSAERERALDEAQTYLDKVVQAYTAKEPGVMLTTAVAQGKDVAEALILAAERGEEAERKRLSGSCDLIAMTTHGRSGLQRLSMGSVTESVLGRTKLPLLVVHPPATGKG